MSISYSLSKQPHQIKLELASNLKVIRKSKKWTQAELAEKAEVSLGRLSEFETLFNLEQDEDVAKLFSV